MSVRRLAPASGSAHAVAQRPSSRAREPRRQSRSHADGLLHNYACRLGSSSIR